MCAWEGLGGSIIITRCLVGDIVRHRECPKNDIRQLISVCKDRPILHQGWCLKVWLFEARSPNGNIYGANDAHDAAFVVHNWHASRRHGLSVLLERSSSPKPPTCLPWKRPACKDGARDDLNSLMNFWCSLIIPFGNTWCLVERE